MNLRHRCLKNRLLTESNQGNQQLGCICLTYGPMLVIGMMIHVFSNVSIILYFEQSAMRWSVLPVSLYPAI